VADPAGRTPRWDVRLAQILARRRVVLGYILGLAAFLLASPTPRSLAIGAAIASIGEAMRVWAAGHLEKGREVTTTGPYGLTRHPLYVGSAIMGPRVVVAAHTVAVAILVFGYLAVTYTAAIRSEEAHLTDKFGGHYPAYRDGTAARSDRQFSFARAMRNREYRALLGLAAVMALLAAKYYL